MPDFDYASFSHIAVLLLGGMGTRFGSSKPKQFLPMGGKALCLYGAEALENSPSVDFIVYVIPAGYERNFNLLLSRAGHKKPSIVITGGLTRQESGRLAVEFLHEKGGNGKALVLLQDGDRPRLLERYLEENFAKAERYGAAVTAIPSSDSVAICKIEGTLDGYLPRKEVWLLQTPQAFRLSLLCEAQESAKKNQRHYSDDASLVLTEKGVQPHIVIGSVDNLKITTPEDQRAFERGIV
jgi:2-C-methyl-D-erythritol 4-phosphate cytidylyltransferase